jgi:SAM-dependent methyltransferase
MGCGLDTSIHYGAMALARTTRIDHDHQVAVLKELWGLEQKHLSGHPQEAKELGYLSDHLAYEPAIRRQLRAIDRMMPYVRGRVLEWGCRHAPDSAVIRMRVGESVELHGADVRDGGMFEPFFQFSGVQYKRLADPVLLPFPDLYFDAIIANGVLEHVPDPDRSLRELHRVLTIGGTLLIDGLPNRWSYTEAWNRLTRGPAHERRFTLDEITAALRRHGFRVVTRERVEMAPAMLSRQGRRARRAYERAQPAVDAINRTLNRTPLSLFATSLALAAVRDQ